MLDPINLVCVSDNHYVVLMAGLLKSIEVNHLTEEKINVYIVEDGIKRINKKKLIESLNSNKIKINWIKINDAIPTNFKLPVDQSSYPKNIHVRIFIPHFMTENVKRVIYMDVDMIVLKDISELWKMDIGNNTIAAVQDSISPQCQTETDGGIDNYLQLGLTADTKLFNSGLIIMDVEKWMKDEMSKNVIDIIEENKEFARFPDQYGLNVGFANKWFELDKNWNAFADRHHENPSLIHFFHRKPIYQSYSNSLEYKEIFYSYLHQTKWKNFKPIGEFKRYLKKAFNILSKKIS